MDSKTDDDRVQVDAIVSWLDSAPNVAKAWLRDDVRTMNTLVTQRNQAFQMIGQYDGAMSEECKATFRERYKFLKRVVEWCQNRHNSLDIDCRTG